MPTTSTVNGVETTNPSPYLQEHIQQLLDTTGGVNDGSGNFTGGLIYEPDPVYQGDRIADFTQDQNDAFELGRTGIGAYQPYMDQAGTSLNAGLAAFSPEVLAGINGQIGQGTGQFSPEQMQGLQGQINQGTGYDIGQEYLNPYQENVIDTTMQEVRRQQGIDFNNIGGQAANQGAFGGSRHGLLEAETLRGYNNDNSRLIAGLNSANFTQAQNAQEAHRNRQLTGAQLSGQNANNAANAFLTGADISGRTQGMAADTGLQGAQISSGLGQLAQNLNLTDVSTLSGIGSAQQGLQQLRNDTEYSDFEYERNRPYQQAGFYGDILNGVPSSQQAISNSTTQGSDGNDLADILGSLGTLATIGNDFNWWGND